VTEYFSLVLTARQRDLIRLAFQIAVEDGSIYGSAETKRAMAEVDAEVEAIEAKLKPDAQPAKEQRRG
jgi:hypothetical protein